MRVALLCPGLGRVFRGHESFARDLFDLLKDHLDITLFKGAGEASDRERVVPHIARDAPSLDGVHLNVSPRWKATALGEERLRIECVSFAWAALGPLLEGGYDVIHCLDRDVCNVLHANRHLFTRTPRLLFSNGGAMPAMDLPHCDRVQEHTELNLKHSVGERAFLIPHGVDTQRFRPGLPSTFRQRHGIPADAPLMLSVGTICYWHKRMDHVIREMAAAGGTWHLALVGQDSEDAPAIRQLGRELLGERVHFDALPHHELPAAYAAADAFVLGSLFETFGIVYIEAMAAGLPVFCTQHPNQRSIVKEGVFVDMARPGALADAVRNSTREQRLALGQRSRTLAEQHYDLGLLRSQYLARYAEITAAPPAPLPALTLRHRITQNLRGTARQAMRRLRGQAD
jgi:1,2-diacylglycerol 3-alpha-glucosyltransferase